MELQVGILTVSDRCSKGEAEDKSGPAIHAFLEANKEKFKFASTVRYTTKTVPDERDIISKQLIEWSDVNGLQLIVTTGGTGFAPRDVTPEATKDVIHKEAPGFVIAMITASLQVTHHAMLSRPAAGIRNKTLIINLPGSPKACNENLQAIIQALPHGVSLMLDAPKASEQHGK